ncbi:MAG TPA: YceI family protein [Egicoccus sp.]|nr:YceI family protein [Egicoccus sp.]HSK23259.1 YceI family protein [Egicoccus sp.]
MSRNRKVLATTVVAAVGAGAAIAIYLSAEAPEAVDIDAAVEQVGGADAVTEDAEADLAGTWSVDPSIGTFSVTESSGTFVGFRVAEELTGPGEVEAIGRTPAVSGSLTLEGTVVTEAGFEADMTQLVSDRSQRDRRMRDAVGAGTHPMASFVLTDPVELGALPAEGETVQIAAEGELTVNGVSRPVTVPLDAAVSDGVLVVTGSFPIVFADHDVTPPSAPVVVSVDDNGIVELQLFLSRG